MPARKPTPRSHLRRHAQQFTDEERRRGVAAKHGLSLEEYDAKIAGGWKWCHGCRRWQHIDDFGRDRGRGDGRQPVCRAYKAAYDREYAARRLEREMADLERELDDRRTA